MVLFRGSSARAHRSTSILTRTPGRIFESVLSFGVPSQEVRMLPLTLKLRMLDQADAAATAAIKNSYWLCRCEGFEVSARHVEPTTKQAGTHSERVGRSSAPPTRTRQ
jgi:hypothetical protein